MKRSSSLNIFNVFIPAKESCFCLIRPFSNESFLISLFIDRDQQKKERIIKAVEKYKKDMAQIFSAPSVRPLTVSTGHHQVSGH